MCRIVTALYFCIAADLAVADANGGVYVSNAITTEYIDASHVIRKEKRT